jgi:undecaprenyl-phosphate 4-deoxy-4-formamido-L-arabinose transferase
MVDVSVVIPVYNSEACLAELFRQLEDALRGCVFECIFVDDQSADGSWGEVKRLCETHPNVTGIRLRKNCGQDGAILCVLRRARGAFAVVMDDDLQHSPHDVPALLAACRDRDWDVCYGRFPKKRQAWWKNAGSWLNDKLADVVIGKPKGLYLSPFKVVRKEVADEIAKYAGPFPYVDGLLLGVTASVGQIDVAHHERYRGRGHYGVSASLLVFLRVATGFSVWPLRFSSYVGAGCSLCGFALAGFYFVQRVAMGQRVEGWATLVILQLVIGGLLLLAIGWVGEYLGRLYLACNGKPQSTIKEICNE